MSKKTPSLLLYADSERNADPLYFGRVGIPDPFIACKVGSKKYAVVSALEFGRVKRTSAFDKVLPLEAFLGRSGKKRPGPAEVIQLLARDLGVTAFTVPDDFPAALFVKLRALGLKVTPAGGPLFPSRETKTPAEAEYLRQGNRCSAAGILAARSLLAACRIRGGRLVHKGSVLTSERLKVAIEIACIEAGGVSSNTIAAGGDQACDPHNRGSGPLRANELIIVDVFPRMSATGYHGDMTRTFLRGRASDAQRAIVAAVHAAQKKALATVRAGVPGSAVHRQVTETFAARGFETRSTPSGSVGFFHGTGHGLGLDIHEPPRMNSTSDTPLKLGAVVTVEPGLYYPGVGACRIEDVVQVTAGKPRMLSSCPYIWELR
jgi:Xaa-Pro aminopeptidase